MSAIFVSHSSSDNSVATAIHEWLESKGHHSVFLDFDPEDGIPAGRHWEQELYMQLRVCRAVIVLCSPASMQSKWVFAEVTQARAMGKHILPVKIGECAIDPLISDRQAIDLTARDVEGYDRLWRGLAAAGIDPEDVFDWDATRPPYPGLLAFEADDAAVFFGRDDEILAGLDLLNRVRRRRSGEFVMVLGASGSGKSSLARAGLVPRLRRDPERWLVLDPIRPHRDPVRELAAAFTHAFADAGDPREWTTVFDELGKALASPSSTGPDLVAQLARDVSMHSRRAQATVLIVVDQFEGFLGHAPDHPSTSMLALLRRAALRSDGRLMVLGTMRSDFLGDFQRSVALQGLDHQTLSLGPMSADDIVQVIERPAAMAGIELESGLTSLLVAETRSDDALPLLAFTLRQLWEKHSAEGHFKIADYEEDLGGLEGAVANAADGVIRTAELDYAQRSQLRRAMLAMVRMSDDAKWARRPARWEELPTTVHGVLERLVDARLLVSSSQGESKTVEVAHEALFRSWDLLASWLDQDAEALRLHRDLQRAASSWVDGGRSDSDVWRGARLGRAVELADLGDLPLNPLDRDFITASQQLALAEQRAEEQRRRRSLRIAAAVTFVSLALAGAALYFYDQATGSLKLAEDSEAEAKQNEEHAEELAELASRAATLALAARARAQAASDPALAVGLAAEAHSQAESLQTIRAILDAKLNLRASGLVLRYREHEGQVLAVAYGPDGRIASGGGDNVVHIWNPEDPASDETVTLEGHTDNITDIAWCGQYLATASPDMTAIVWDIEGKSERAKVEHSKPIRALTFDPDCTRIVTGSDDGTAKVWTVTGEPLPASFDHDHRVRGVAFDRQGTRIATASWDGKAAVWNADGGGDVIWLEGHTGKVLDVAFDSTGRVFTAGEDSTVRMWDTDGTEIGKLFTGHEGPIISLAFSSDGQMASTGQDGTASLYDFDTGRVVTFRSHIGPVRQVTFSPTGEHMATGSVDGTVAIWTTSPSPALLTLSGGNPLDVAYSAESALIATAGEDNMARLWDAVSGDVAGELEGHEGWVQAVAFSSNGELVATASRDNDGRVWDATDGGTYLRTLEGHEGWLTDVAFGMDDARIATASRDSTTRIWDAATGDELMRVEDFGPVRSVAFGPDGTIVTAGDDGVARVWDATRTGGDVLYAANGDFLMKSPSFVDEPVRAVAYSPDGRHIAMSVGHEPPIVWALDSGDILELKGVHTNAVRSLAFSSDGSRLMTGGDDGAVIVWDLASSRSLISFPHGSEVLGVSFLDGDRIATANTTSAKVWDIGTADACDTIDQLLTLEELDAALDNLDVSACTNLDP